MRIFAPSQQFSAKDMASHTKMKYRCGLVQGPAHSALALLQLKSCLGAHRQVGQNSKEELLEKDLAVSLYRYRDSWVVFHLAA